jgi:MFS family permease
MTAADRNLSYTPDREIRTPMNDSPSPDDTRNPPIYETPDDDRAASAAPTEQQLQRELPNVPALDDSPAPAAHDPYAALRLRDYRLYALSFIAAVIGAQVQSVAIAWQVYQKTNSALSLGWIGGIQVIPLFLLALPAGHLSDIVSRKKLLLATQWMLAAWGVLLAFLSYYHHDSSLFVPAMYGIVLINAITLTFARPARAALLPQLVPGPAFNNAVAWNASMFETSSMIGPAIGGAIIGAGGAASAYLINAALLVASALLTSQFVDMPVKRRDEAPGLEALIAGVGFVWRRKIILATLTLDLFAVLLGGAIYLLPIFAKDILNVGPTGYGWLRAAPSFGACTMALIIAHRPPMRRAGRAMLTAVGGFGLATIVFGLSRNFWLSFLMLICAGAFDNISVVVRHTLVQLLTPNDMRGRVSAVNQVFIGSSNELGGLESGVTAKLLGPVASVVFGGIGTLITVGLIGLLSPDIRKLGRLDELQPEEEPNLNTTPLPVSAS